MDSTIFGLRFKSNEDIQPAQEDLRAFLDAPRKEGRKERPADDVAKYAGHLRQIEDFEARRRQAAERPDFNEKMIYGVLSHSHFYKPALKSAVELYFYHNHRLSLVDLKKPLAFIRSAEEEIGRLNPKKKDDQAKIAKLQGMIEQRNRDLEGLKAEGAARGRELASIVHYIRDNLAKIQKLCESSIGMLVGLQVGGQKETQLIEDIKAHFKDHVRDILQVGPVTREYLDTLKEDVARLSKQMSKQVLEDIYSITGVYEQVHDYAKKGAERLDTALRQVETKHRASVDEEREFFARMERLLIDLMNDYAFKLTVREAAQGDEGHDRILAAKRSELLDHIFGLLEKASPG